MSDPEYTAVARVQVLVEVDTGPYGKDWDIGKIHEDAERTAREKLERMGVKEGMKVVSILGVHQVIAKRKI